MNDASTVCRFEGRSDLNRQAQYLVGRQRTVERLAFDVLEDEIPRPDVVDLADVRVVQARDRPRFFFEPAQPIGLFGDMRRKDLDSDLAAESAVTRPIHLAHPAGSERRHNFIGPESGASCQRHLEPTILVGAFETAKKNLSTAT
jgi:hypothetical protein